MSQSQKTLEFLQKLKDSGHWNDNYDYSEVDSILTSPPYFNQEQYSTEKEQSYNLSKSDSYDEIEKQEFLDWCYKKIKKL